ncbi:uncharacterized protein DEA37_0002104 [Paragonimus westermani]|uniref:Lsm14-like N-terminal domain-containing protein n=1 Tax=Paragonimus westermani TaxID=34504 RepID=A0A5J4NC15_9TREM|nr:uncharacterized protein DEA37_0002104 [Paragonimus westermani]
MHENYIKIKSKAGLEYTGILHSIDTKNSTVTLKRVLQISVFKNRRQVPKNNCENAHSFYGKVVNNFPNSDHAKGHKHDPAIVGIDIRTQSVPQNESYKKPSGKNYNALFPGQMPQSSDVFSAPVVASVNQSHTAKTVNTSNTTVMDNVPLSKRVRSHSVIFTNGREKQSETLKGRSRSLDLRHSTSDYTKSSLNSTSTVRFIEQNSCSNGTHAYDRQRSFYDRISTAPVSRARDPSTLKSKLPSPKAVNPYGVPTHRTQRKSLNFNRSLHNTPYSIDVNYSQPICFPATHHQSQQHEQHFVPCNQFTYYTPYGSYYPRNIQSFSQHQASLPTYHPNWQRL